MAFYASSFSFAGRASELYNLRIANLDESISNNSSGEIEILQKFIYKRPKPFFYGIHYNSTLSFPVSIFSPDEITAVDASYIANWLFFRPSYERLAIIQNDMDSIYFNCIMTSYETIRIGGVIYGFNATCQLDSSFGWTYPKTSTYTFSSPPSGSIIQFFNDSHYVGYLYPEMTITASNNSGSITITNYTDGSRVTSISGLSGSEVISLNCDLGIIESSIGERRLSTFNKNFLRLVPGINNLSISGSISSMSITYQFARRLGG